MRLFRKKEHTKSDIELVDQLVQKELREFQKMYNLYFLLGQVQERNNQYIEKYCTPMSQFQITQIVERSKAVREAQMILWRKEAKEGEL